MVSVALAVPPGGMVSDAGKSPTARWILPDRSMLLTGGALQPFTPMPTAKTAKTKTLFQRSLTLSLCRFIGVPT
jgi:hypothetical protein